ncbi:D-alanyl-D-alanine carboxypeptidase family protein [Brassicibacter mesophilus]|uniref:D-alanyl-D-alanine carboxypeptidase family protein n=1 Tax=Brassicibacter mesophilus TaxID=745119 RepID=UPI003D201ACA
MKKNAIVFSLLIFIISISTISYADTPEISADSAILIDAKTGVVLFEKNANQKMFPASTTKILTAIIAIENGNLDQKVIVDDKTPYGIDGSHIALEPGEILTMDQLIHALLIESANDAAIVIAKHISGSVEEFAKLMNNKAKEIGAKNSNFVNPNGLPNENHTTTAYDLAAIARYAMKNPKFREIVSSYTYTIPPTNIKTESRPLKSANRLLYSSETINVNGENVKIKYEGANGIKTGYTVAAQQCLVSSATRNGQSYISVVLHAVGTNVYIDTHKLLNYGFDNFTNMNIAFGNEFIRNVVVENGDIPIATGIVGQNLYAIVPKGRENDIKKKIILPDKIKAPVTKGQVLGKIEYTLDNKAIGTANIVSAMEVNQRAVYDVVNPKSSNSLFKKWWFWIIVILISWRIYIEFKRRKRRNKRRQKYLYSK